MESTFSLNLFGRACAHVYILRPSQEFIFSSKKFQIINTNLEFGILLSGSGVPEPSHQVADPLN